MTRGGAWGIGHAVALLVIAGAFLVAGASIPVRLTRVVDVLVGLMLLGLGIDVFRRMREGQIHVHVHRHADGTAHIHAHHHASDGSHADNRHEHHHRGSPGIRPLLVGIVHGIAGSGALVLLISQTVGSHWTGLAYIAIFGVGSTVGMTLLWAIISLPTRSAATMFNRALPAVDAAVGVTTCAVGLWVLAGAVR
jgi:hypothetical protein